MLKICPKIEGKTSSFIIDGDFDLICGKELCWRFWFHKDVTASFAAVKGPAVLYACHTSLAHRSFVTVILYSKLVMSELAHK
jgi:hypothetical protein